MTALVKPHGGAALMPLMLEGAALREERKRAATLPRLTVSSREKGDLVMLGSGGFTPLAGFMNESDWKSVCRDYQMADGLFWPIPITLSAARDAADAIKLESDVALVDEAGELLATMTVTEKYSIDKEYECKSVFRTTDIEHPGVRMVME